MEHGKSGEFQWGIKNKEESNHFVYSLQTQYGEANGAHYDAQKDRLVFES